MENKTTKKSLAECKDEVARKENFNGWKNVEGLYSNAEISHREYVELFTEASELYASQFVNQNYPCVFVASTNTSSATIQQANAELQEKINEQSEVISAALELAQETEGLADKLLERNGDVQRLEKQNAELQRWKSEQIIVTAPLYEVMQSHPEIKLGESCVNRAVEFIKERDELKKQNAELVEKLKQAFSDYVKSEGCACCQDSKKHDEAANKIGDLLQFRKYEDGSGYDFYQSHENKQHGKERT